LACELGDLQNLGFKNQYLHSANFPKLPKSIISLTKATFFFTKTLLPPKIAYKNPKPRKKLGKNLLKIKKFFLFRFSTKGDSGSK
jgi:hypothetical protein